MAKRFYKAVDVAKAEGGFHIHLDGRTLKTPGKSVVLIRSQDIAALIAAEWDAQIEEIDPTSMPLTRLVNVAIEGGSRRQELIDEAKRYAGSDLLCYRQDTPIVFKQRQDAEWGPWIDWAAQQGAAFTVTSGIIAVDQPEAALSQIAGFGDRLDHLGLTLFVHLTAVYGSAILAWAVMSGALDAGEAFDVSRLDHIYQAEQWGEDEQAQDIATDLRAETVTMGRIIPFLTAS